MADAFVHCLGDLLVRQPAGETQAKGVALERWQFIQRCQRGLGLVGDAGNDRRVVLGGGIRGGGGGGGGDSFKFGDGGHPSLLAK